MKPALTPEEWAIWLSLPPSEMSPMTKHQNAALCLHGQEFGFTREDVERLNDVLESLDDDMLRGPEGIEVYIQPAYDAIASIRERIEALLPPSDA